LLKLFKIFSPFVKQKYSEDIGETGEDAESSISHASETQKREPKVNNFLIMDKKIIYTFCSTRLDI